MYFLFSTVVRRKIMAKIQYDLESAEKYDFLELTLSCVKLSFLERKSHAWLSKWREVRPKAFFLRRQRWADRGMQAGPESDHFRQFFTSQVKSKFLVCFLLCFNDFSSSQLNLLSIKLSISARLLLIQFKTVTFERLGYENCISSLSIGVFTWLDVTKIQTSKLLILLRFYSRYV